MAKDYGYYAHKRDDIIKLIPAGAKHVMDVGCGLGAMASIIKKDRKDVNLLGVEIDPDMGEIARAAFDEVIIGDVEKIELPFAKGYFDCIIYGDILEHLIDPWGLLKRHRDLLSDKGVIIASIPNVAYYRTLRDLRKYGWIYQDAGIFDRSHMRFFTIQSIKAMFKDASLDITGIEHKLSASTTRYIINNLFPGLIKDSITTQYVITARKDPAV